ncbi:MAG: MarC family protein [Candidatus Thermoplasmatota archaeon]|nr:MarC family protein [Candidatus Thermoplasmatota archaeon]
MAVIIEFVTLFLAIFIPMIIIVDPLSTLALFISMTSDRDRKEQILTARDAIIYASAFLVLFAIAGRYILDYMGISIEALKVSGGLLLAIFGLNMLKEGEHVEASRVEEIAEGHSAAEAGHQGELPTGGKVPRGGDIALVPLAIPLLAGPGAISFCVVAMGEHRAEWYLVILAIAVTMAITFTLLLNAPKILKYIGPNGTRALTRIMGFLTVALGIAYAMNGLASWIKSI